MEAGAVLFSETELIERYFRGIGARRDDVVLGIGDDAALLAPPGDAELVLTTDALVENVHFLPGAPARSLGHRALAVNLSDIAAMGASPRWMLLSLTLAHVEARWLEEFRAGLDVLARRHDVALVGGNLSRGPLSITITLAGSVPRGQALRRDGGQAGEDLYVSGSPGEAGAGRELLHGAAPPEAAGAAAAEAARRQALCRRFEYPEPRVALGQALRGLASAAIDVSDGLYADAARLAAASGCGVRIDVGRLPLSAALTRQLGAQAPRMALAGGEDYELCFSAPPSQAAAIERAAAGAGEIVTRIGVLQPGSGVQLISSTGQVLEAGYMPTPFDHFRR